MSVIALTSAKGSPGVTTTALALALSWPRPTLLLEADVAGSSSILAGYLRGAVRHQHGLVDLAKAERRAVDLEATLRTAAIALPDSQVRLVAGLTSPAQAKTIGSLWEALPIMLTGLERTGTDVIIDAGRLGAVGGPMPLLRRADVVLLMTRSTLPAIAATRARAGELREDLAADGAGAEALRLLVVGEGHPYSGREIATAIGLPVLCTLAWDPVNAEVFSLGASPGRKFTNTALVRSVAAAGAAVREQADARRARLDPGALIQYPGSGGSA